ncbi:hypothetical protein AOC05_08345 [Arthrobacter alpinus]|uniref:NAD-dependent epimerase/dehydratase domain-containing protein n=1 Tax=Arthrobacter alpinus TaxID=656366 RepID=A0A0M3UG87_9MICC|nr:NAD-dependent epimerase/dehydratase family protein [Arthrobacter alpinus]ALE92329.1 hypothetical protein AOC05_08345 [Arthrobacter alpinus]
MTDHQAEDHGSGGIGSDGVHVVVGAGPIGLGIAKHLTASENTVRVITLSGETRGLPASVRTAKADASDPRVLAKACQGAAVIYFAAAPPYHRWADELPAMQEGAIQAAAETGAVLVVAENLYGYGTAGTLHETHPLQPNSQKGSIRAQMSARLFGAHRASEIRAVSGRASDFFGPGVRRSQLGAQVWPNLVTGKSVWWLGDPDATHTFTYAPDFSRALVRLGAESSAWGRAWHVPSPPDVTLRQALNKAADIAAVKPPSIRKIPRLLLRAAGLIFPLAAELPEVAYQFDNPFLMDWKDYRSAFGDQATSWDTALKATLSWWEKELRS